MIKGPIGVFDSGFGGLTVLNALSQELSEFQFYYLGDNADRKSTRLNSSHT